MFYPFRYFHFKRNLFFILLTSTHEVNSAVNIYYISRYKDTTSRLYFRLPWVKFEIHFQFTFKKRHALNRRFIHVIPKIVCQTSPKNLQTVKYFSVIRFVLHLFAILVLWNNISVKKLL